MHDEPRNDEALVVVPVGAVAFTFAHLVGWLVVAVAVVLAC